MTMFKEITQLSDLTPDDENVNSGTERGSYMLDWSLSQLGAGRSILADAEGRVIAGNKTLEAAAELQLPVKVVQTSGKELVVVQRTDLRLKGEGEEQVIARQLGFADNRVQQISYAEDAEMLLRHLNDGVDLSAMYREDELKTLLANLAPPELGQQQSIEELWKDMPAFSRESNTAAFNIIVHMKDREALDLFAQRMEQLVNEKTRYIWFPYQPKENLKGFIVTDSPV